MLVVVVRHGETCWNKEKRFQGRKDSPLTEKGLETARRIAEILKDRHISAIYSSPLGRALETAKLISKKIGGPVVSCSEMIEYDYGIAGGHTREEVDEKCPGLMGKREENKFYFKMPGGESYAEVEKRVQPFIERIKKEHLNQAIVLVGHEMVNRTILKQLLGLTPEMVGKIRQPNNCIYFVELSKKPRVTYLLAGEQEGGEGLLTK